MSKSFEEVMERFRGIMLCITAMEVVVHYKMTFGNG